MKRTIKIEIDRCLDCMHSDLTHYAILRCSLVPKVCNLRSIPKWCPLLKKGAK